MEGFFYALMGCFSGLWIVEHAASSAFGGSCMMPEGRGTAIGALKETVSVC